MTRAYRFTVRGAVQRVGFRAATAAAAQRLTLCGWVRNRGDGSVYGAVRGQSDAALAKFRRFLEQGPPTARVEQVEWIAAADADDAGIDPERPFQVRYDRG
ncbi:MAG TPA: acylphosphatase [Nevskiaceae bacterium]